MRLVVLDTNIVVSAGIKAQSAPSRIVEAALDAAIQTAADLHRVGGMDQETMRKFDTLCLTPIQKMTPKNIRDLRAREKASQTVFCRLSQCHTQSSQQVGAWEKSILRELLSSCSRWFTGRVWRLWLECPG